MENVSSIDPMFSANQTTHKSCKKHLLLSSKYYPPEEVGCTWLYPSYIRHWGIFAPVSRQLRFVLVTSRHPHQGWCDAVLPVEPCQVAFDFGGHKRSEKPHKVFKVSQKHIYIDSCDKSNVEVSNKLQIYIHTLKKNTLQKRFINSCHGLHIKKSRQAMWQLLNHPRQTWGFASFRGCACLCGKIRGPYKMATNDYING